MARRYRNIINHNVLTFYDHYTSLTYDLSARNELFFPCFCLSICLSLHMSVSPYVCLSICPSLHMSVSPCVCLSMCLCLHMSVSSSIYLSICLSLRLLVWQPACISIWRPVYLHPCLSLSLSVHLSIWPSVHLLVCPPHSLRVYLFICLLILLSVNLYGIHQSVCSSVHLFGTFLKQADIRYIQINHIRHFKNFTHKKKIETICQFKPCLEPHGETSRRPVQPPPRWPAGLSGRIRTGPCISGQLKR